MSTAHVIKKVETTVHICDFCTKEIKQYGDAYSKLDVSPFGTLLVADDKSKSGYVQIDFHAKCLREAVKL